MQNGLDSDTTFSSAWKFEGTFWVVLLVFRNISENLMFANYVWCGWWVDYKIAVRLKNAIFRKSLSLNSESKAKSTLGEMVNLVSEDANRWAMMTIYDIDLDSHIMSKASRRKSRALRTTRILEIFGVFSKMLLN